jgi:hypothetical protein
MSDGKIEIVEGVLLNEDGVGPFPISAHTTPNAFGFAGPGIVYSPLGEVRNGDMVQFTHTIHLCGRCGRPEGICECQEGP